MNDFERYQKLSELRDTLATILAPEDLSERERAIGRNEELSLGIATCRLIATPRFIGCVAAWYVNEDGIINPESAHGTDVTVLAAGIVQPQQRLVNYEMGPYFSLERRSPSIEDDAISAMTEAVSILCETQGEQ